MRTELIWLVGLALLAGVCWALPALAADAPSATPEQLAALDAVLARPEFQIAQGRSTLDRLLDPIRAWVRWLGREIERLIVRLLEPAFESSGGVIVLALVGVSLMIVVGAALVLRRLVRGAVTGDASLADVSSISQARASDELARARELARAGHARRAVHHQYRAVLLRLDERDHLPFDGALTNRELVPRLTAAPELSAPFTALVGRFDQLWYGQTDCSADECAAFAQLADLVWQAADTVAPARADRHGASRPGVTIGASSGAS